MCTYLLYHQVFFFVIHIPLIIRQKFHQLQFYIVCFFGHVITAFAVRCKCWTILVQCGVIIVVCP